MSKNRPEGNQDLPSPDWGKLPSDLKQLTNWGVYDITGNKRPTSVVTGYSKAWNRPENWATFDQAVEFCDNQPDYRPGFFFSPDNRAVGVDLDSCRDPKNGQLEAWAETIIESCDTYTEISLSGTGVKLIGLADNWERGKIVHKLEGMPQHGSHVPQIDLRFSSSFFGLTGCVIREGLRDIGEIVLPLATQFLEQRETAKAAKWKDKNRSQRRRTSSFKGNSKDTKKLIAEFNRLVSIGKVIKEFGWIQVGQDSFQRPGKSGDGHSATTRIGLDGVERIAFWTTEAGPFETSEEESPAIEYSAFDCWLLLRFDGDFGAAIRAWKSRLATLLKTRRQQQ